MNFFRFEDPWFLIFFLVIPYLVWKRKEQLTINYSSLEILQNIRAIQIGFLSTIPLVFRLFAISLFIIALARPQEGYKRTEILSMGVDIMLALDTSGSMQALDFIKALQISGVQKGDTLLVHSDLALFGKLLLFCYWILRLNHSNQSF